MADAKAGTGDEVSRNTTRYINNLNEKKKIDIEEIAARSLLPIREDNGGIGVQDTEHKGQAWVVFEDVNAATNAIGKMQDFPFYDKPMRIQFAKTKSDIVAKADGNFCSSRKTKEA